MIKDTCFSLVVLLVFIGVWRAIRLSHFDKKDERHDD